jgi:hypothetical protein
MYYRGRKSDVKSKNRARNSDKVYIFCTQFERIDPGMVVTLATIRFAYAIDHRSVYNCPRYGAVRKNISAWARRKRCSALGLKTIGLREEELVTNLRVPYHANTDNRRGIIIINFHGHVVRRYVINMYIRYGYDNIAIRGCTIHFTFRPSSAPSGILRTRPNFKFYQGTEVGPDHT